jgi:hypothetical protein
MSVARGHAGQDCLPGTGDDDRATRVVMRFVDELRIDPVERRANR